MMKQVMKKGFLGLRYDDLLEHVGYLHRNVVAGELISPKDFTEILKFQLGIV